MSASGIDAQTWHQRLLTALRRIPMSWRWAAFGVSLLALLGFNAWLAVQSSRQVFDHQERVRFGLRVEARINTVLSLAKDIETGTRGYLLSGSPSFLVVYGEAMKGLDVQISDLGRELARFPENAEAEQRLFAALRTMLEQAEACIAIRDRVGPGHAELEPALVSQKAAMDELRQAAYVLRDRQSAINIGFGRELEATRRQALIAILVPSLISMLLAGLLWSLIVRDFRRAERSAQHREQQLQQERELRAEAEAASQAKDDFVSAVSHELRTPLQSIVSWTQVMQRAIQDQRDAPVSSFSASLDHINRHAAALSAMVDDLLDASTAITGRLRLHTQRVDLAEILGSCAAAARPAAEAREQQLRLELEAAPLWLIGDADRLRQIFGNLLGNALKFTPPAGRIDISAARVDTRLQVRVRDSGIGIDAQTMPMIFERYFQSSASTTRHHRGLGLGLATVKHLVEMHGGQIEAHSQGRNRGAEFVVSLPIQALALSQPQPIATTGEQVRPFSAAGEQAPRLSQLRLLVVDDDPDVRTVLELLLTEEGASVATAATAGEALDALQQTRFDIVLSDIAMPEMDGYALAHRVRGLGSQDSATPSTVPMLALTAFSRGEDARRALASGFDAHLGKPIDVEDLIAALREHAEA